MQRLLSSRIKTAIICHRRQTKPEAYGCQPAKPRHAAAYKSPPEFLTLSQQLFLPSTLIYFPCPRRRSQPASIPSTIMAQQTKPPIVIMFALQPTPVPVRDRLHICRINGCDKGFKNLTDASRHKWAHLPAHLYPTCPFVGPCGQRCSVKSVTIY
jgi:hypothetical protein